MPDYFDSISHAQPTRAEVALNADTRRLASAGLSTTGGIINLGYGDPKLRGQGAIKIYLEMGDDAACGVLLTLIQNILAGVDWDVREASPSGQDVENAQFVKSCMDDMGATWHDFIGNAMSMVPCGFAPFETTYKVRDGRIPSGRNTEPSQYSDQKIGWADFQLIGQDTIYKWDFDHNNRVLAVWQQAPPRYQAVQIPEVRLINFRLGAYRDNPMGWSLFRRAYAPWRQKRALENIEGIAIERELCGLPVIYAPPQVLAENAPPATKKLCDSLKKIARDMRTDEQMGVVFPNAFDPETKQPLFRLELLNSGGSRSIDISRTIDRYTTEIFRTALADFLGIGTTSTNTGGSYALHSDKTQLFLMGLRSYLKSVAETLNRVAVPRLFAVNGIEANGYPEIYHSPLDQVDLATFAGAISSLSGAGMSIFPNPEIEARIFEILGLPAPVEGDQKGRKGLEVNTQYQGDESQVVYPGDKVDAEGKVVSGTPDANAKSGEV